MLAALWASSGCHFGLTRQVPGLLDFGSFSRGLADLHGMPSTANQAYPWELRAVDCGVERVLPAATLPKQGGARQPSARCALIRCASVSYHKKSFVVLLSGSFLVSRVY